MTEQEWLTSEDPAAMLNGLESNGAGKSVTNFKISDRKLRLFACACWRHLWPLDRAEAFAVEDWVEGNRGRPDAYPHWVNQPDAVAAARDAAKSMWPNDARLGAAILRCIAGNPFRPVLDVKYQFTARSRADAVWFDRIWKTPQVLQLAHAVYDVRAEGGSLDPLALMALADALEEAGVGGVECGQCPKLEKARVDESGYYDRDMVQAVIDWGRAKKKCRCGGSGRVPHPVLAHLREPGPHWRGCWAVDLVLGKE